MLRNRNIYYHRLLLCILLLAVGMEAMGEGGVAVKSDCPTPKPGGYEQGYGPFDYTNPEHRKNNLPIVELYHFNADVASLTSGMTATMVWGDIDYTLRAFPNHHRALQALADLAIREKATRIGNMHFSVPCFFIRAQKFAPADGMVSAIYAYYLAYIGQRDLARTEAEQAVAKKSNNPKIAYEVGLAYYYIGDYKMAREYADKAKSLGSTAIGLDKLLSQTPLEAGNPGKPEAVRGH